MDLYISGPMTGYPEFNKPAFRAAAEAADKDPRIDSYVNPADVDPGVLDPKWLDYMRADIKELVDCDAIAMLPGSKKSKGACIELAIAKGLGFEILIFSEGQFKSAAHPEEY